MSLVSLAVCGRRSMILRETPHEAVTVTFWGPCDDVRSFLQN